MDRTEFKKAAELVGYLKRLKVIFPIGFPYTGKLGASTPEYKRQLFDELVEHYNALKKLEEPSLYWDIKNELQGEFISAVTDRSPENVCNTIELIRKWFDLRVYKDPYHEKIYELPFFLDLIDNGIATEDEVLLLSLHMEAEIMYRNRLCEEIKEAYTSLLPEKVQADEKPAKETLHTEQKDIIETPKPTRGRGRPVEPFTSKMVGDDDGSRLRRLHDIIDGKKGKSVCLHLFAAMCEGWLEMPTYTQVAKEFKCELSQQLYSRYMNGTAFKKEELDGARKNLK
jgi:hypothetical protein